MGNIFLRRACQILSDIYFKRAGDRFMKSSQSATSVRIHNNIMGHSNRGMFLAGRTVFDCRAEEYSM